uniref:WAP domain-containing protein n=1 Tax=Chelydra serpentina TaxID=8475 RepID=A0A8C3SKA8_CHESE
MGPQAIALVFIVWLFSVTVKAGTCPLDYVKCYGKGTHQCAMDYDCKEQDKCCYQCSCRAPSRGWVKCPSRLGAVAGWPGAAAGP